MFYQPGRTEHHLPHDPFKACVIPRPIGWISTVSPRTRSSSSASTQMDTTAASGVRVQWKSTTNLAPYSQFNNLSFSPPYVMFSANQTAKGSRKDTVRNAEETGVFCWQLATWPLRAAVNITAEQVSYGIDEFELAGLEKEWSKVLTIPVPMVKQSPVKFECEYISTLRLPGNPPMGSVDVVIGKVVGVHIDENFMTNGKLDVRKTQPIARCGYFEYAIIQETFEMIIPGDKSTLMGLEGSVKYNEQWRAEAEEGKPTVGGSLTNKGPHE